MCGRSGELTVTKIEGTELRVCKNCTKYGRVIRSASPTAPKQPRQLVRSIEPAEEYVVEDIGAILKMERISRNMDQPTFAQFINVKESILHKVENSRFIPSLDTARAIGKKLNKKLVHQEAANPIMTKDKLSKDTTPTLGDIIKIKKE